MTALSTLDLQDLERKHGPNLTTSKIIPVEPNGEPKSQRAKVLWNTFVDNCTLHGLYYAFHSRTTFRKLVWAFFVLAGVSWFIFQSSKLLTKYFSYPISTKVTLEHESLSAFPAVTICNFNVFKRSVLPKWYHKIDEHDKELFGGRPPDGGYVVGLSVEETCMLTRQFHSDTHNDGAVSHV